MTQHSLPISKRLWKRFVGQKAAESLILFLSRVADINLLYFAYNQIGILKYQNSYISGEQYVIRQVLKHELDQNKNPVFFDVGANLGGYSQELRAEFPNADIFAFEPNPYAFHTLEANLQSSKDHCFCLGLGNKSESKTIFSYETEIDSQHASIYKEIFLDHHHATNLVSVEIQLTTMDEFCQKNDINRIDFLKIDVEGYELEVLQGAKQLLENNRLRIIQFEFNATHVFSRVFLRDFYLLLKDYDIYRLNTESLIHLPYHDAVNEIFQFQNFLAIHKAKAVFA